MHVVNLVMMKLAEKDDDGWSEAERALFNEARNYASLSVQDFERPDVAAKLRDLPLMTCVRGMHNRIDEYGRKFLLSIIKSPPRRRFIEEVKGSINSNQDVESLYGMTNMMTAIFRDIERVGGNSTLAGVEAARAKVASFNFPWALLNGNKNVRYYLDVYFGMYETFQEGYDKLKLTPGFEGLPGESRLFSLLRVFLIADSSHPNFTKVSAIVGTLVRDAQELVYDSNGDRMTDDHRAELLRDGLCKLDDTNIWKSETKKGGHTGGAGGGRVSILNAQEKGKSAQNALLSGVKFHRVCRVHLHTGTCPDKKCAYTHLTTQQRQVYPTCADKGCKRGFTCMFKHAGSTVNLAAEEQTTDVGTSLGTQGASAKPAGQLLLLKSVDDDSGDEDSN